jgi:hypothetical protein
VAKVLNIRWAILQLVREPNRDRAAQLILLLVDLPPSAPGTALCQQHAQPA